MQSAKHRDQKLKQVEIINIKAPSSNLQATAVKLRQMLSSHLERKEWKQKRKILVERVMQKY